MSRYHVHPNRFEGLRRDPERQWQIAREKAEKKYRREGWHEARCEVHGGGVTVTLWPNPQCDGRIHICEKLEFCCQPFEHQLWHEHYAALAFEWPRGPYRSDAEPAPIRRFRIQPFLSDVHDYGTRTMTFRVLADEKPLVNHDWYAIDLNEWDVTLRYGGGYFLLTCGCGSPGCANIEQPMQVEHGDEWIEWRVIQPFEAVWRFNKADYVAARDLLINDIRELVGTEDWRRIGTVPYTSRSFLEQHGLC